MVMGLLAASDVERWIVLLPALIVGAGIVLAVLILLGRALATTVRESGHPRLILGGAAAMLGLIVLLTYLGIELPRE
jgi:hypothetical protein